MPRLALPLVALTLAPCAVLSAQTPFLIEDINPGPTNDSDPALLTAVGDRLVFQARVGSVFEDGWSTDGTSANTFSLQVDPVRLIAGGVTKAFLAYSAVGSDLWVTDGTVAGTTQVPVNANLSTGGMVTVGDQLYAARGPFIFTPAQSSVITTDGTTVQTLATYDNWVFPWMIGRAGEDVIWATGGALRSGPYTLYSSSGGELGTLQTIDWDRIYTSTNRVFMQDENLAGGIYETDGTRLRTVFSGVGGPQGASIIGVADDDLYFRAFDGSELAIWIDDLETPSPRVVTTFSQAGTTAANGWGAQLGDGVVFWGVSTLGFQPWYVDENGAYEIGNTGSHNGCNSTRFVSVGSGKVFFYPGCFNFDDLYWTDGTVVEHLAFASSANESNEIALAGGLAYFPAYDGANGLELWALNPGATAKSIGRSCGGPWLRADDPVLGTTAAIRGEADPGHLGAVLLSGGSVAPGTKLLGCELYVNPSVSPVFSLPAFAVPTSGEWSSALNIPSDPVFAGAPLLLQAAFIGGGQVTMSNGSVLFLGN